MKLSKKLLLAALLSTAISSTASAADSSKFGLGYTGMYYGNYIQGISARGWFDAIGVEANIGNLEIEDENMNFYSAKAMYAPIIKSNSKFYLGLEAGIVTEDSADDNVNVIRPFFGSEYFFEETPELSFSWEAGYMRSTADGDNVYSGTTVSVGIHYYF